MYSYSAPVYYEELNLSTYLEAFYAWLIRSGAHQGAIQILERFMHLAKIGIFTEAFPVRMGASLSRVGEKLHDGSLPLGKVTKHLHELEKTIHLHSPRARLICMIMQINPDPYQEGLFEDIFCHLEKKLCSTIQTEGIIRDLQEAKNPNPEELFAIFKQWAI